MAAAKESNELTDTRVVTLIEEFKTSEKKKWMNIGEQYYSVENDIKNHENIRKVDGNQVNESYKANNRIAHAKYKNQVDEKVAYLLSKPVTYKCEKNESYAEFVKDILGKHFQHQFTELGYDASNKGISWLHVYVDEDGDFKTMVIPAEQCIPVWKDASHTEITIMIRIYVTEVWEYSQKKTITNVEIWDEQGVKYYRLDGKMLIYDRAYSEDEYGPISHIKDQSEGWRSWGKIPFIPFKNNMREIPDIKFVKSVIDGYDSGRSEAANYIEDVKNLIYVLKGYGGANLNDFMRDLNTNRAIKIDDVEDGGVDVLTPQMDITALREHYEQLKRDIVEDGQSINKDLDKIGNSPSGVALKFMYAGLDLKCNLMESEFKIGFEMLLYFIDEYLKYIGRGDYTTVEMEIVFNRNMTINESEQIQNCNNSKDIIADKTILAHHPYVNDVEEEMEALEEQQSKAGPQWDKVPPVNPVKEGEEDGQE